MSLINHFSDLTLTDDQTHAVSSLESFLKGSSEVFMLKGYAGSGKTTLISGLVKHLKQSDKDFALLAPTGRAAKVITDKTKFGASTIHRSIYNLSDIKEVQLKDEDEKNSFKFYFDVVYQEDLNTVFIIDEASMISNVYQDAEFIQFGSGKLLNDLINFSRIKSESSKSKIIFVGDPAQLPPVGMGFSPALDKNFIQENYNLTVNSVELSQVVRQEKENTILKTATNLRKSINSGYFNEFNLKEDNKFIYNSKLTDFIDTYNKIDGNKIVITYKNKTADSLNKTIRLDKFKEDLCIQSSDIILIGKNNYQHNIVNGDFGIVNDVHHHTESREVVFNKKDGRKEFVTLTWREISLIIFNENRENTLVQGYMLENFLVCDNNLSPILQQALYVDFIKRNPSLKPGTDLFKEVIKEDPYFNAIQLKYGYAVTCHKAQGGEWENVIVVWDHTSSLGANEINIEKSMQGNTNEPFYRWAYTAITRPSSKLFSFNTPFLSPYSKMMFIDCEIQSAYHEHTNQSITPQDITEIIKTEQELTKYNITDVPGFIQNHYLKINNIARDLGGEIENFRRIDYELQYTLIKNEKRAGIKFWFNGKGKFNTKTGVINCDNQCSELFNLFISKLPLIDFIKVINPKAIQDSKTSNFEYDKDLAERMPFLVNLYSEISMHCKTKNITIEKVDHLDWKERYCFNKDGNNAVIDFEYNSNGIFGRVLPMVKECDSNDLLKEIKVICNKIKLGNEF